jgi:multidrug resistance efflux pump
MTWGSRFRLLAGTLVVLVIAALATYKLNENKGVAASDSAQILGKTYDIGTPYAGLVVDQLVEVGDEVAEGEPMFVVDSASLQYDIVNGFAKPATTATQIDAEGRLVILATGNGTVTELGADRGTFVQAASKLATVQRENTLYVQAEYTLTANEYARVDDRATASVELPNHRTIQAQVSKVQVETVGGEAQAVMTLTGPELKDGAQNGLVSSGTPVTATLQLSNDGVVTRTADAIKSYVEGIFG